MVSAFWVWLGWASAMWEGVRVSICGEKQFAWAAFGRRGGQVWGFGAVCGGRVLGIGRRECAVGCGALHGKRVWVAGCGGR